MGSIAGWWDDIHYELRVIVENGFSELVDGGVETLRSALEDEKADGDEDGDAKKTVQVTMEELLASLRTPSHGGLCHRTVRRAGRGGADQGREGNWETGDGVEGAEDWLDGAEEGATLPKVLEKRRKELLAELGEDDRRTKELVKTTPAGKPSKGSVDWMRAQGIDVREFVSRAGRPRTPPLAAG